MAGKIRALDLIRAGVYRVSITWTRVLAYNASISSIDRTNSVAV